MRLREWDHSKLYTVHVHDFPSHSLYQILYTGDFSRVEDRHLMAAELPPVVPDILVSVSGGLV